MRLFIASLFFATCISAQPTLAPPQMGFVQDSGRSVRPAYGVAGNFVLGPPIAERVVTHAFSGSLELVKTGSSLAAFNSQGKLLASVNASAGPALFGFSPDGTMALAYLPSSNTLVEWSGTAFVPLSLDLDQLAADSVLAIAFPSQSEASFIVERNGDIWESGLPLGNAGAASESALPGVHAPLFVLPSGALLYTDSTGIVIQRPDASEVHIVASLPASLSLQQMGADWVELMDLKSFARFAIRATAGREAFYRLPESSR